MIIRKIKVLGLASVMLLALIPINSIEAGAVEALTSAKVDTAKEQVSSTKATIKDGWQQNNNLWYFYKDGKMQTGWVQDGTNWFYMNSNGTMYIGWLQDGSNWFYLNSNGAMAYSTEIGGYYLGANGAWIPSSGASRTGLDNISTILKMGYFYPDGYSDSTVIRTLCLREGGKSASYTNNRIVYGTSTDGSIDEKGSDMIIKRYRNDVDTNSELDQLFKVIMPGYEGELRQFFDSSETSTSIGGRTITKDIASYAISIRISPR